jgi:hypothetical protein
MLSLQPNFLRQKIMKSVLFKQCKNNYTQSIGVVVIGLILLLSGCRYEEGSGGSVVKVEKRIRGLWSVSSVYKNGEKTDTESPTVVESKNAQYEFYKTRILLISFIHNDMVCKSEGSWDFSDDKKILKLAFKNIYYPISREYEIIKFKNKELKVRFTDDDGVVWTLILSLEQSFVPYEM